MDGGAWWVAAHGVAKSGTRLSNFTFTFHFHALEKEMATHSSVLAWRIPGMGESGGLPSMGSHRVGNDWSDLAAAAVQHSCIIFTFRPQSKFYLVYFYQLFSLPLLFPFPNLPPWHSMLWRSCFLYRTLLIRCPISAHWIGNIQHTLLWGFPGGSDGKEFCCSVGDPGLIPGSGRYPGEGNGNLLQYFCLENPTDREAW